MNASDNNLRLHSHHSHRHPACHSVIRHPRLSLDHENIDNDSIRMILNDLSLKLHSCHSLHHQPGHSVIHHRWPSPDHTHIDDDSILITVSLMLSQLTPYAHLTPFFFIPSLSHSVTQSLTHENGPLRPMSTVRTSCHRQPYAPTHTTVLTHPASPCHRQSSSIRSCPYPE